jgi:hypothetical protein
MWVSTVNIYPIKNGDRQNIKILIHLKITHCVNINNKLHHHIAYPLETPPHAGFL